MLPNPIVFAPPHSKRNTRSTGRPGIHTRGEFSAKRGRCRRPGIFLSFVGLASLSAARCSIRRLVNPAPPTRTDEPDAECSRPSADGRVAERADTDKNVSQSTHLVDVTRAMLYMSCSSTNVLLSSGNSITRSPFALALASCARGRRAGLVSSGHHCDLLDIFFLAEGASKKGFFLLDSCLKKKIFGNDQKISSNQIIMWEYIVCGVIVLIAVIALVWFLIHMMTKKSPKASGVANPESHWYTTRGTTVAKRSVRVYFSPGCGWCNKLKQELSSIKSGQGIEVLMFNVAQSRSTRKA